MPDLFDTETTLTPPSAPTVRALVDEFGYRAEKVEKWSAQRAETVLRKERRLSARDANRGAVRAAEQDEEAPAAGLTGRHLAARLDAAAWLEEAVSEGDPAQLEWCVWAAVVALTDQEMRDTAALLAMQLRRHPQTGELLAQAGCAS